MKLFLANIKNKGRGQELMKNEIQDEPKFYTTADVRRILGVGDKTCLELFHRQDFPCIKIGKAFKISVENFNEYFKVRRVF